jgi:SnoaL-like domain
MNYEDVKAKLLWNWSHDEPVASEIYTDDALLEFPQSGEKFRGKKNFITWRSEHSAQAIEFELRSIRGEGDTWIAEGRVEVDGGEPASFVDVLHFRGDLVDRETIYQGDPFPASEARAPYAEPTELDATPGLPVRIKAAGNE